MTSVKSNEGISYSVIGLLIGIITLFGGAVVFFICTGWAAFEDDFSDAILLAVLWTLFTTASVIFSMLGRKKMRRAGRSGALGLTGIVIGLFAELLSLAIIIATFSAGGNL